NLRNKTAKYFFWFYNSSRSTTRVIIRHKHAKKELCKGDCLPWLPVNEFSHTKTVVCSFLKCWMKQLIRTSGQEENTSP
ncbi:unnamed protein product, partial [Hymenolepis diminuta]